MEKQLNQFCELLKNEEKSENTIQKYRRDIQKYLDYLDKNNMDISKESVIGFKKNLLLSYSVTSSNSMIVAVNNYLKFIDRAEYCVKIYKHQEQIYRKEERSLELNDYKLLLKEARLIHDERAKNVVCTFAETGIRVSELKSITVDSLNKRQVVINNKGKIRTIILTENLTKRLKKYCENRNIKSGAVFITKSGKPIDRFYIWRLMKNLALKAKVLQSKVFPHNFRHLFAKQYYKKERDIARLADFLGHSSIETTRIYISTSNLNECRLQLEKLFSIN